MRARTAPAAAEGLSEPAAHPDRAEVWEAEHYRRRCHDVAPLLKDELIEEHHQNPWGYRRAHSLELQRLERLFKTYPANGVRYLPCTLNRGEWRVGAVTRDHPLVILEQPRANSLEEIVHEIFLLRVAALRDVVGPGA